MKKRDRELLRRFRVEKQSRGRICGRIQLIGAQVRWRKSRTLARLGELGRARQTAPPQIADAASTRE